MATDNPHSVRVRLVFAGRVQGVGFRAFVQQEAARRRVVGWVRNTEEGTVEAEVEGASEVIHELIDVLRAGPPLSRVDHCDVRWIPAKGTESSFEIIR